MDLLFTFNECGTARQLLVPLGTSAHTHRHYSFLRIPERLQQSLYVLMPRAWLFHLCVYSVADVRPLPWCVACYPRSQSHYHLGLRFEEETETVTEWHVASVSVVALIRTFQMANSSPRHWKLSERAVLWSSKWFQLLRSNMKRRRARLVWFWDSWSVLLLSTFTVISAQILTAYWDSCA